MRHTSRKTIVNAKQCTLLNQHIKPTHCRRYRGVNATPRIGTIKQHVLAVALTIVCALCFSSISAAATNGPQQTRTYHLDLPEQTVATALNSLSEQTDIQVLFPYDIAAQLRSEPLLGRFSIELALERLLRDTGLHGGLTSSGVITISQTGSESTTNQNGKGKRMNTNKRKKLLATFITMFTAGVASHGTMAQMESAQQQSTLDEIVVTAEKRAQNVQDVPVSVTAFSADMMEARGIATPQDLQFSVPGLVIGEQYQGPGRVNIRGIGTENYFPGGDPGVPIHVNGHYTQNTAYVLRDMLDVERAEVLRGPQGTLYGRNAIGGNINIITKRPSDVFQGSFSGEVGNYNKRHVQAVLSGPISDNLRGRLAVSDDDRDGYIENVGNPSDDRETSDYTSVRGALEYDLTSNIQVYLNAYYFDDVASPGPRVFTGDPANVTLSDPFKISNNTPSQQINKSEGVSLDITWDLGSAELRSLTGYDDTDLVIYGDRDATAVLNAEVGLFMPIETLTQEFQLLSTDADDLKWVLGLFYYAENSRFALRSLREQTTNDVNGDGVVDGNDPRFLFFTATDVESTSLGIYGQVDYSLTEQLELVLGLRYSIDEKTDDQTGIFIAAEGLPLPAPLTQPFFQEDEWEEVTGKIGLNYHVNDDVMMYGSFSQGYKAGGFALAQVGSYDPEYVDAFELGLKSRWMDNRIQVNVAAFHYDYTDKQDFQRLFDPVANQVLFKILNAAAATSTGFELEIQAQVTEALFIDASLGYLDAEFDDFTSIDNTSPIGGGLRDLSGNKLPYAPEVSVHVGIQYDWMLADLGALSARVDYSRTDEQFSNAFNRTAASSGLFGDADFIPSYYMVNANMQWTSADESWHADLYVKNLTDEVILSNSFVDFVGTWGTYLAPRTYGLKVGYSF